jgi:hypothetical protein
MGVTRAGVWPAGEKAGADDAIGTVRLGLSFALTGGASCGKYLNANELQ